VDRCNDGHNYVLRFWSYIQGVNVGVWPSNPSLIYTFLSGGTFVTSPGLLVPRGQQVCFGAAHRNESNPLVAHDFYIWGVGAFGPYDQPGAQNCCVVIPTDNNIQMYYTTSNLLCNAQWYAPVGPSNLPGSVPH
jgi:hypothetical protein